jgi:hypothetical protein
MVRAVELGTPCPKFKTSEAPTCLGNFLGNCDYRIGVIPMKAGVSSTNSMVSGTATFPDSRLRISNQPALDSQLAVALDNQSKLAAAKSDHVAFIRGLDRAVIDEVQRAPDLLLAIKQSA